MRILFPGLLLVLTAATALGGERKPNTLTAEEVREGWILLFDGETTFGWQTSGRMVFGTVVELEKNGGCLTSSRFGDSEVRFEFVGGQGFVYWQRDKAIERVPIPSLAGVRSGRMTVTSQGPSFVGFRHEGKTPLRLHNVKLRPLNTNLLFNGADLTGWKPFPGKKSTFTVEDGAITIKDGPGDLQTVGKYKDFILQLECKSNGKHLNSGVFFRCRDGEYQNGYEAQIRNQFTAEPKQVYTIEEYDPKSHELIGKKKVKYTAVDYGTGAIYRRQPARREVARDGEWFTMTVLAHENHFATWVNGIQVTDWTDNRPPTDNARTGFRREAGHSSFQGHDPTTNLSFRNIRIAELK